MRLSEQLRRAEYEDEKIHRDAEEAAKSKAYMDMDAKNEAYHYLKAKKKDDEAGMEQHATRLAEILLRDADFDRKRADKRDHLAELFKKAAHWHHLFATVPR